MKKRFLILILILVLSFLCAIFSGCEIKKTETKGEKAEIIVFVAASLSDGLTEIVDTYKKDNPQVDIKLNFASSGNLQKQISEGAPADLFISAGIKQMDDLEKQGMLEENTRIDLLKNQLVLITSESIKDKIESFNDLEEEFVNKISIGTPETVPAG